MELLTSQKLSFSIFLVLKGLNKIKNIIQSLVSLKLDHFLSNFKKILIYFWFFTETLTLSLPISRWAGDNIDLPSNRNILKTARVNIDFTERCLILHKLSNGMQVGRLCTCGSQVIYV